MKILFLGSDKSKLFKWLNFNNELVLSYEDKIPEILLNKYNFDFLISYRYRYIIKQNILNYFPNKAINLHISFLPYNRGADPNLWSFIDNTKKGISIHYIDSGIDTGDLLIQKEFFFNLKNETLRSTYNFLNDEIQKIFISNWEKIKNHKIVSYPQNGYGTYHKSSDKNVIINSKFFSGWDTPCHILSNFKNI